MRTLLLLVNLVRGRNAEANEFSDLACAAGLDCQCVHTTRIERVHPRFFIGKGKADALRALIVEQNIELVVVSQTLSPSQERNLERYWQIPVLDRFALILDIFAQRARSHEGKLQVEMAQLQWLSTRLVSGWSHLERQRGGIGLRGPGEKQLETDRRLLRQRIRSLKHSLQRIHRQRELGRQRRRKHAVPVVALMGYTNAGKSTLFNRLTGATAWVADLLFATLDPEAKYLRLPSGRQIALIDTVGFLSDLPHELIEAFQATLKQVQDADLLLHVIDMVNPELRGTRIAQVDQVIRELAANTIPQIYVYNKIDRLSGLSTGLRTSLTTETRHGTVFVSAASGKGIPELLHCMDRALDNILHTHNNEYDLEVPLTAGSLRSHLFQHGVVVCERSLGEDGWNMRVKMNNRLLHQLCRKQGLRLSDLQSCEP